MSVESVLAQWARKTGKSVEELRRALELIKSKLPADEMQERKALAILGARLAPLLRSKAVPFEAVIIGVTEKRDLNARRIAEAKELFMKDRERAILDGICAPDGTPLDNRKTLPDGRPNPRYGKPLRSLWQRVIWGIGKPKDASEIKLVQLVVRWRNEQSPLASLMPELGKKYTFLAIPKSEAPGMYIANASKFTSFTKSEDADVISLLQGAPAELRATVETLVDWHEKNKQNLNRLVIVEGDVINVRDQPTERGSRLFFLGDVLSDIELEAVPVFVPEHVPFPTVGSRVIVVGSTSLGVDLMTGERTRIILNAFGIFELWSGVEVPIEL